MRLIEKFKQDPLADHSLVNANDQIGFLHATISSIGEKRCNFLSPDNEHQNILFFNCLKIMANMKATELYQFLPSVDCIFLLQFSIPIAGGWIVKESSIVLTVEKQMDWKLYMDIRNFHYKRTILSSAYLSLVSWYIWRNSCIKAPS